MAWICHPATQLLQSIIRRGEEFVACSHTSLFRPLIMATHQHPKICTTCTPKRWHTLMFFFLFFSLSAAQKLFLYQPCLPLMVFPEGRREAGCLIPHCCMGRSSVRFYFFVDTGVYSVSARWTNSFGFDCAVCTGGRVETGSYLGISKKSRSSHVAQELSTTQRRRIPVFLRMDE